MGKAPTKPEDQDTSVMGMVRLFGSSFAAALAQATVLYLVIFGSGLTLLGGALAGLHLALWLRLRHFRIDYSGSRGPRFGSLKWAPTLLLSLRRAQSCQLLLLPNQNLHVIAVDTQFSAGTHHEGPSWNVVWHTRVHAHVCLLKTIVLYGSRGSGWAS